VITIVCFSLFPLYLFIMFLCSVTLWQPAVFYSVLVPYLRTHRTLKPTYIKDCKHYNQTYCYIGKQFSALSDYIVSIYNEKKYLCKELCSIGGVEQLLCAFCVSTCLHFRNSFYTPAVMFCFSIHFRRRFKLHFQCSCKHENQA